MCIFLQRLVRVDLEIAHLEVADREGKGVLRSIAGRIGSHSPFDQPIPSRHLCLSHTVSMPDDRSWRYLGLSSRCSDYSGAGRVGQHWSCRSHVGAKASMLFPDHRGASWVCGWPDHSSVPLIMPRTRTLADPFLTRTWNLAI